MLLEVLQREGNTLETEERAFQDVESVRAVVDASDAEDCIQGVQSGCARH